MECLHTICGLAYGFIFISSFTLGVFLARSVYQMPLSNVSKLNSKISFNFLSSIIASSNAIAAFGFITFILAIISLICSFVCLEIVRYIFGFLCFFSVLGLMISEGLYYKYTRKYMAYNSYTRTYDHGNAQKYIIESIEELYNQGYQNLKEYLKYLDSPLYYDFDDTIATWSTIEKQLGNFYTQSYDVFTYHDFWTPYTSVTASYNFIKLNTVSNYINANIRYGLRTYSIPVASTVFKYTQTFTPKDRYCWYIDGNTDIECTVLKGEKQEITLSVNTLNDVETLTESIVVGDYLPLSESDGSSNGANYKVSRFPSSYRLLSFTEAINIEEIDPSESTNHFKVKGQQFAKALVKDYIKSHTNTNKYDSSFYMSPSEPSSVENYKSLCDDYFPLNSSSGICQGKISFNSINNYLISNYEDSRKGIIPPSIKKFKMGEAQYYLDRKTWISMDLYVYNFVCMILNVFADIALLISIFI